MKQKDFIIKKVCDINGITVDQFYISKGGRSITRTKQILHWYIRNRCIFTLTEIGKNFGNITHSNVMHGLKKINNAIETNDELTTKYINKCVIMLNDNVPYDADKNWFHEERTKYPKVKYIYSKYSPGAYLKN